MKYLRVQVTSEFLSQLFRAGDKPSVRIIDGIPDDARLIHIHHDDIKRVWDLFFTSETAGHELQEGEWILGVPVSQIVFQRISHE